MATKETSCRIRLYNGTRILDLADHPDTPSSLRQQWASSILAHFRTQANEPRTRIRELAFLAHLDGSVERVLSAPAPASAPCPPYVETVYPVHYRLPLSPSTAGLSQEDLVLRAEIFALRSLLYEVLMGHKPFEDLPDDEVQRRFAAGEFPADANALEFPVVLPSDPSDGEASQAMVAVKSDGPLNNALRQATTYARAHPYLFGMQAAGLVLVTAASCVVPVLGAVGFTAAGPAAGSAAAAWQASMGAVQAGSLFAWCQSAAMGGTAVGGVQAVGLAGAALARAPGFVGMIRARLGIAGGEQRLLPRGL